MGNLTTIEQLVLENVEKKGAVVLTEDLFDFEDFDRQEFPLVERALNTLADKHKKIRRTKPFNFTIFPK